MNALIVSRFKDEQSAVALKAEIAGDGFAVQVETVDDRLAAATERFQDIVIEPSLNVIGGDRAPFITFPTRALE